VAYLCIYYQHNLFFPGTETHENIQVRNKNNQSMKTEKKNKKYFFSSSNGILQNKDYLLNKLNKKQMVQI
jgi:hypothetical protein